MSICRHLLLRAHVPRILPTPFPSIRLLSDSSHAQKTTRDGAGVTAKFAQTPMANEASNPYVANRVSEGVVPEEATAGVLGGNIPRTNSIETRKRASGRAGHPSRTHAGATVLVKKGFLTPQLPNRPPDKMSGYRPELEAYKNLRRSGGSLASEQSIEEFKKILFLAVQELDDTEVSTMLADDVLQAAPRLQVNILGMLVEALFGSIKSNRKALPKDRIVRLLQALQSRNDDLALLSSASRMNVAATITSLPEDSELDATLRAMLIPLLCDLLVDPTEETRSLKREVSEAAIWPLYRLALDLVREGRREQALEVVRKLVKTRNVSPSAIRQADLQSGDFRHIVLSAAVRSCMQWGWRDRGSFIITNSLSAETVVSPNLAELAVHFAAYLLDPPRKNDLKMVASIIMQLMARGPKGCLPSRLLQDFYSAAIDFRSMQLIEAVYAESRTAAVLEKHSYPPSVSNGALLKLMRYFSSHSKNIHLARELASQVVQDEIPLATQLRSKFIELAATQGLATSARALWERYSTGPERTWVVGNSATMVRMVSLFVRLAKDREEQEVEMDRNAKPSELFAEAAATDIFDLPHPVPVAGADLLDTADEPTVESPYSRADARGNSPSEQPARADPTVSEIPDGDGFAHPANPLAARGEAVSAHLSQASPASLAFAAGEATSDVITPGADYRGVEEDAEATEAASLPTQSTAEDLRTFAVHVLNEYRACRPMASLKHQDLNALARVCFMLRMLPEGFEVFRTLLVRREVPDTHDVNVVLALLAESYPAGAAKIIERMMTKGMQPDTATFGTVIHHAVVHGDIQLMRDLLERARQLGIEVLDYKTVGTLIRASITESQQGEPSPRLARMANLRGLIDSLLEQNLIPSSNMGRDCVIAALRMDAPKMAFWFWKQLVKDKVQWDDEMQAYTRRRLAARIRSHLGQGGLTRRHTLAMLSELREPLSTRVFIEEEETDTAAIKSSSEGRQDG